ncbi:hypothetical protein [Borrelia parkeri]|uniref:hypothetical protein n=1 Tax=Borrelia parkeri TaxID=141 RepID=UPI001FF600AE|nr:hypothetical protein [Borrelia parkeri]
MICFVSCDLFKDYNNKNNKDDFLQKPVNVNLKSDWRDNLGLNKEETGILTFLLLVY